MHTLEFYPISETYHLPENINELTQEQAEIFYAHALRFKENSNPTMFRIQLAVALLDIRMSWKYRVMNENVQNDIHVNLSRIAELLDSFFEERLIDNVPTRVLQLTTTKNFFPRIKNLIGPADALTDITFKEYREIYECYRQFAETQDEYHLNKLIAILWREKRFGHWILKRLPNYNGKIKVPYNPAKVERRIKKIANLKPHIKFGILNFIIGSFEFLRNGKPHVGGVELDFAKLYGKGDDSNDGIGLTGILFTIAETKIFGDVEKTDNQNLYDVMVLMYQKMLQAEELKEKYNSHDKD